jgi:hypothetical protein
MPLEMARDHHGGGALMAHADMQGAQSAQEEHSFHGPQHRAQHRAHTAALSNSASVLAKTIAPATTSE